ncbi:MAG: DUF4468 domain-containing protein [Lentimicrobiaceae bacterium]|nr:DUF4468 domain-containing protein [Lentimicrobiaceae bacterium]
MKSLKTFLAAAVVLFSGAAACGQKQQTLYNDFPPDMQFDENTKLVTYKEVVRQKGSQDELYERALKWANGYFSNPTVVIQKKDKIEGTIVCVSNIRITTLGTDGKTPVLAGYVYYTFTIETKEGRYRYIITDLYKKETSRFPIEKWFDTTKPEWSPVRYDHLHQIDQAVKKLIEDLEEGMQPEKVIIDEW